MWTHDDICAHLCNSVTETTDVKVSDLFCYHFNVQPDGNVDPLQVRRLSLFDGFVPPWLSE